MVENTPSNPRSQPLGEAPTGNGRWVKKFLWRIGVLAVALLIELLIVKQLFFLGLGVDPIILGPLMLIIMALFAAVGASWFGTLLAPDCTRTRLLPVVGVCAGTAAILSALIVVLSSVLHLVTSSGDYGDLLMSTLVPIFLASLLIVPLSASWAVGRFRNSKTPPIGWGATLTFVLAAAAFVVSIELLGSFTGEIGLLALLWPQLVVHPELVILLVGAASVALSVVLATWQHVRGQRDQLGMDAAMTLGLVGLALLILIGTLYVAELYGLVGA